MTATDLKKRAIALAEKTKIDSVTPEEVGQLSNDIVEYIENVEINGSSLGIRKTYTSVSAMEADSTAPKDDKGVLLRRGMLVNIYNQEDPDSADNGKVFSFQNPGWAFRGTVDAGYATKEELTELEFGEKGLSFLRNLTSSIPYIDKDIEIEIGTINASSGKEEDNNTLIRTSLIPYEIGKNPQIKFSYNNGNYNIYRRYYKDGSYLSTSYSSEANGIRILIGEFSNLDVNKLDDIKNSAILTIDGCVKNIKVVPYELAKKESLDNLDKKIQGNEAAIKSNSDFLKLAYPEKSIINISAAVLNWQNGAFLGVDIKPKVKCAISKIGVAKQGGNKAENGTFILHIGKYSNGIFSTNRSYNCSFLNRVETSDKAYFAPDDKSAYIDVEENFIIESSNWDSIYGYQMSNEDSDYQVYYGSSLDSLTSGNKKPTFIDLVVRDLEQYEEDSSEEELKSYILDNSKLSNSNILYGSEIVSANVKSKSEGILSKVKIYVQSRTSLSDMELYVGKIIGNKFYERSKTIVGSEYMKLPVAPSYIAEWDLSSYNISIYKGDIIFFRFINNESGSKNYPWLVSKDNSSYISINADKFNIPNRKISKTEDNELKFFEFYVKERDNKDEITYNYIYVNKSGGFDFTSFSDAVKSIKDNTYFNRYIVYVYEGVYDIIEERGGKSFIDTVTNSSFDLMMPSFTTIIGVGLRDNIQLKGYIPTEDCTKNACTLLSTIACHDSDCFKMENFYLTAYNMRYACHIDKGPNGSSYGTSQRFKKCKFEHQGGDNSYWTSYTACGNGTQEGHVYIAEDCEFKGSVGDWSVHDWKDQQEPSIVNLIRCKCTGKKTIRFSTNGINTDGNLDVNNIANVIGCNYSDLQNGYEDLPTQEHGVKRWDISGYGNNENLEIVE